MILHDDKENEQVVLLRYINHRWKKPSLGSSIGTQGLSIIYN